MAFNNGYMVTKTYNCEICGKPVTKRMLKSVARRMKYFVCESEKCISASRARRRR